MSDTTAPQQTGVEPPNTDQGQGVTAPSDGGTPSGQNDGGATDGGQDGPDPQTQILELRRKVTELGTKASKYEEVLVAAAATPEWDAVSARLNGQEPGKTNPKEEVDSLIQQFAGDDVETQNKFRRLLELTGNAVKNDVMSTVGPTLRHTQKTVRESNYQKGLEAAGLNAAVADDEEFKVFASEQLQENKWLQSLPAADQAKYLGNTFKHESANADQWQAQNARLSRAKAGTLQHSAGGSGGQVASSDVVSLPANADMRTMLAALQKVGGDTNKLTFTG